LPAYEAREEHSRWAKVGDAESKLEWEGSVRKWKSVGGEGKATCESVGGQTLSGGGGECEAVAVKAAQLSRFESGEVGRVGGGGFTAFTAIRGGVRSCVVVEGME
jgi:hypothetical protein